MTESHISTAGKGLRLGSEAPKIDTQDIDGDSINLDKLLEKYRGVLIDLFRGSW
jgi:hypothetical protein